MRVLREGNCKEIYRYRRSKPFFFLTHRKMLTRRGVLAMPCVRRAFKSGSINRSCAAAMRGIYRFVSRLKNACCLCVFTAIRAGG